MHPFLVPGEWFLEGDYFPSSKKPQRLVGITEVHASEEFPETLRVSGEVRDAETTGRPVPSSFHLDVIGPATVRFRMDSIPLGTVLVGGGHFNDHALVLRYASPDRRFVGVESYVSGSTGVLHYTGVILADGAAVTSWLARLERARGA